MADFFGGKKHEYMHKIHLYFINCIKVCTIFYWKNMHNFFMDHFCSKNTNNLKLKYYLHNCHIYKYKNKPNTYMMKTHKHKICTYQSCQEVDSENFVYIFIKHVWFYAFNETWKSFMHTFIKYRKNFINLLKYETYLCILLLNIMDEIYAFNKILETLCIFYDLDTRLYVFYPLFVINIYVN